MFLTIRHPKNALYINLCQNIVFIFGLHRNDVMPALCWPMLTTLR